MVKTFRFSILSDTNWETKVDRGLSFFSDTARHFEIKDYGADLDGIVLVMMCRSPELNFKQRKRYSKKEKFFYLDIMLDYKEMVRTKDELTKGKIMLDKINNELFPALGKYKFKDFDLLKFQKDFKAFVKKKGLLDEQ